VFALIHRSAWNTNSRKFISKILHIPFPMPLESPLQATPHSPVPLELVTLMDRYAELWMCSVRNKCLCKPCVRVHSFCVCEPLTNYLKTLTIGYHRQ
jgi:hypothetical protein